MKKKIIIGVVIIVILLIVVFLGLYIYSSTSSITSSGQQQIDSAMNYVGNIGFSVGGAKDINNFRENIKEGYFPISTDITYNGLFYDYTFDTGMKNESEDLFSPSYSTAISKDPISEKEEYYMTVGLNSNIKESDFSRKKLNLVVLLDISGSMSYSLRDYYYDNPYAESEYKSKMTAATESVNILLDQLNDDDRFGMVLFESSANMYEKVELMKNKDILALKKKILEIDAQGGTNFEAGYKEATETLKTVGKDNSDEYENRIIVITDAMPNYGSLSKEGLLGMVENNEEDGIYTTFIGVGVDFNTELVEAISDVKGANYYSVHTVEKFAKRMGEEFEYMVTPLVFDLEMDFESDDYKIVSVYGSDKANANSGNIISINTLFPSKSESGEVKGGVVLLKIEKKNDNNSGVINLNISYKDRTGEKHFNTQQVFFDDKETEYYENTGIRKAIALVRYANTIKNWILYERSEEKEFLIIPVVGIKDCMYTVEEVCIKLGEYERPSVQLSVSDEYKEIFEGLRKYMLVEIDAIGDETMEKEIKILDELIK